MVGFEAQVLSCLHKIAFEFQHPQAHAQSGPQLLLMIARPCTFCPATMRMRLSPKGSSPIIPITIGAWGSSKVPSGHSTNLVKLNKNAALTAYSLSWSDCAAQMPQKVKAATRANRNQAVRCASGNCRRYGGKFRGSIRLWRKRRAS